jgi:hypothetical protein
MDDRFKAWLLDDDASLVIHRLALVASVSGSGPLVQHLPAIESAEFVNGGVTARFQDSPYGFVTIGRRERSITVQADEEAPGRYRLAARCDTCYSHAACKHALAALLHAGVPSPNLIFFREMGLKAAGHAPHRVVSPHWASKSCAPIIQL